MAEMVLLGDEAVAYGAIHAGLTAAYSYPGTPATEIMETLQAYARKNGKLRADWCANEKTAYEAALGVSFAGRRTLVSMKHVGLNVAADPFMNSAIVDIHGGLVLAVADDPGMHSSQNEQDSRYFAEFAHTICLEPANQQETYDMTHDAFELSERFHLPVMVRLVTRLAHSRTSVTVREPRSENAPDKAQKPAGWILLPANARRQWHALLELQKEILAWSEGGPYNTLSLGDGRRELGVITTGIARNYYRENVDELGYRPAHLHIGAYPLPVGLIRKLAESVDRILVLEDGYPYVEHRLAGILPQKLAVTGKLSGHLPPDGELTPDLVRKALGLPGRAALEIPGLTLPNRPPQLCQGCPHTDAFKAMRQALAGFDAAVVTSDIGCYTLAALPPLKAIESCVCMGASVGMAKGASDAGFSPVVAVIGDSTFIHSGITPLLDAIANDTNMTLLILDNGATAMTGGQPPLLPVARFAEIILGLGMDPDHFHQLEAHPRLLEANTSVIRKELEHHGLSVIVLARECLETAKRSKRAAKVGAA